MHAGPGAWRRSSSESRRGSPPLRGNHPGRRLVLSRLPPFEIDVLRIAREAGCGRGVAHELGSPHDAVDGQGEVGLRGDHGEKVALGAHREAGQVLEGGLGEPRHLAPFVAALGTEQQARALADDEAAVGQKSVVLDALGQADESRGALGAEVEDLDPPLDPGDLAHEGHRGPARHRPQATTDVLGHDLRLPLAPVHHLEGRRVAQDEEHERVRVGPGVVPDRLHVGKQELGRLALDQPPEALRAVGFRPHHRQPASGHGGRRVLALGRGGHGLAVRAAEVVALDVGLASGDGRVVQAFVRPARRRVGCRSPGDPSPVWAARARVPRRGSPG